MVTPVVGLCVVRTYHNTFNVVKVQVEAVVVDVALRSRGVGRALMAQARTLGLSLGATEMVASVGTQSFDATRFFMRERFVIQCMGFNSPTAKRPPGARSAAVAPSPTPTPTPTPIDVAASASASSSSSPSSPAAAAASPAFESWSIPDVSLATLSARELSVLRAAESVHRQLRQTHAQIAEGNDAYVARMQRIAKDGGRMVFVTAARPSVSADAAPVVLGVGVYRFHVDSSTGSLKCWVDDLVTDCAQRSLGVGAMLVEAIRAECRARSIHTMQLDSGVQRHQAHKFYFANAFVIDEYSFHTKLVPAAGAAK